MKLVQQKYNEMLAVCKDTMQKVTHPKVIIFKAGVNKLIHQRHLT